MDDDFGDYDRDEIVDLDIDPQLAFGFRSPKDLSNKSAFTAHPVDLSWLEAARRDRAERKQRRRAAVEANQEATRARVQARRAVGKLDPDRATLRTAPSRDAALGTATHRTVTPDRDEIAGRSLVEAQPGQHGAHFTLRTYRRWWWPWTTRHEWVQQTPWQMGVPPSDATIVTVADVAQLPGRVHTLGTVSETGAVEW